MRRWPKPCAPRTDEEERTKVEIEHDGFAERRWRGAPLTCETFAVEPAEPFLRRLRQFLDAIRRAKPLVTAGDALRTLEATLAVQQGARGRP